MSGGDAKGKLAADCGTAGGDGSAPARAAAQRVVSRTKRRVRHHRSPSPAAAAASAAAGAGVSDSDSTESDSESDNCTAAAVVPPRRRPLPKGKQPLRTVSDTGYRMMVRTRAMEAAELAAQRAFVDTHYAYGIASPDPTGLVCRVLQRI
jgi:hypothetical protein